ncbi:MAG TPA: D-glucuronyl C5-epimerase family protein [Gaiellaceae bacterium]|nr:D-glucuronyl C5-epimerase family protein [Gaiellaceae bacterium]
MPVRWLVATLLVLAAAPPAHAAESVWDQEASGARKALDRSVDAGYITPADQARYLGVLRYARTVRDRVPRGRKLVLQNVLAQVARAKSPTAPRALQLYTTLHENASYLDAHRLPPDGTDVTGPDGVVYRYFARQGLEFHPLANASALNGLVAAGDAASAQALADALAQRAVPLPGGALLWRYEFNFGSQRAPWSSGMAQAVLAQALARAGSVDLARRAYAAIPGALDRELPAGPWIRLYSRSSALVLNAQLQSAISIADYAELAHDDAAAAYADRLLSAARALLPRFDTGHWSRYSLHVESDLHYQDYVIDLLKTLASRTGDPAWQEAADRFELYETQPPLLTGPSVSRQVVPRPRDGVRDELTVRFFLSKISKVALVVDGKAVDGYRWHGGWHVFRWVPSGLAAGPHRVRLVASDPAGNPGSTDLGEFELVRDTTAPELSAAKANGRVYWRAKDRESRCCRLDLELSHPGDHRTVPVTRARGSFAVPAGYWSVTVVARDAAGNRSDRRLGLVVGRPE